MLYTVFFTFGVMLAPLAPFFVPLPLAATCGFAGLLTGYRWPRYRRVYWLLAAAIFGLSLGCWQVQQVVNAQLAHANAGRDHAIEFSVVSIPTKTAQGIQFFAKVEPSPCSPSPCALKPSQKLKLSWYRPKRTVSPGDRWAATLRLKRPRGFVNPGGFDYHAWLLGRGVSATGYVRADAVKVARGYNLARLRLAVKERIFSASKLEHKRFFAALLVGDKSAVTAADWQVLRRTGTIHLMAISGLHIGLIAVFSFVALRFCARFGVYLGGGSNARLFYFLPIVGSLMCAGAYAALAGFTLPTQRAFIACFCVSVMQCFSRSVAPSRLLVCGLALLALLQPFAVVSGGFWLSFLAVTFLLYGLSGRAPAKLQGLRAQWVLLLGLAAPLLLLGQGVSWLAPVANLVAVPLVGFAVVPLLFVAGLLNWVAPAASDVCLHLADNLFGILWQGLELLSAFGGLWWPPGGLAVFNLVCLLFGAILVLSPKGVGLRWGGLVLLVASLLPVAKKEALTLTVLDVGQGLAVVIHTAKSAWVYDTGVKYSDAFDSGRDIVGPYLRQQGIGTVNLIVSHNDSDHAGGAQGLVQHHQVSSLLSGEALVLPNLSAELCQRGQRFHSDVFALEVLWPPVAGVQTDNNASCVVLLTATMGDKKIRVLLPGDINRNAEAALLPYLPSQLDLVIAPHHGSKTSSSQAFVRHTSPTYVVFSAGYQSRYHHPNPQVVKRYQNRGAIALNTATEGAISFSWSPTGAVRVSRLRESKARLWY